jgi:hypothetical protein
MCSILGRVFFRGLNNFKVGLVRVNGAAADSHHAIRRGDRATKERILQFSLMLALLELLQLHKLRMSPCIQGLDEKAKAETNQSDDKTCYEKLHFDFLGL